MTGAQEALVALLEQPDAPDLQTREGIRRGFRRTVDGKPDRTALMVAQPSVYRTWLLVDRENERLQ